MRGNPDGHAALDIDGGKRLADLTYPALVALYGEADCTLDGHDDPWKLMVSAILAAQCTDARVNLVTPALFERFPSMADFAGAAIPDIEASIRTCGLFHTKARSIQGSARMLVERFGGQVPANMEDLLALPGIGRKIANLVLGDAFGIPGIVVDTHCSRISRRIGLTDSDDPYKIEKDLLCLFPPARWTSLGHLMVAHGRGLCPAAKPRCKECPLRGFCRYAAGDVL